MAARKKQRTTPEDENGIVVKQSRDGQETFTFFYGRDAYLGNFYPSKFVIDGVEFNCTEQYFHYKKAVHFKDKLMMEALLKADQPFDQKRLGRKVQNYEEAAWNRVGPVYMKEGLLAKFQQNANLRKMLLETVGTTLVEASPRDRKWGIGFGVHNANIIDRKNWRGKNLLGQLLMEVREQLKNDDTTQNNVS